MGYIVGRNSSGATDTARNEKPKADREADSTDTTPPPGDDTTAPTLDSPSISADAPPPESTRPADEPGSRPTKPEPARSREVPSKEVAPREAAKEPPKEVKPKPSPAPPPAKPSAAPIHAAAAGEPASGQYWQVMATARPDAEIIAEALGKKGFHVVLAPAPTNGIFRVLVGPLPDAPTQASTRTNLEAAGFKNPIIRKY